MRKSLAVTFAKLKKSGHLALMPFVPAGYPDLETTMRILPALEAGGADIIEVGIPFSDPIADGPTIQQAFTEALAKKIKLAEVFKTVAAVRGQVNVPLVAMVSYSIVFRNGADGFIASAKAAGFDGLIVPDLPPPEAQSVCAKIRAAGLDTILLIAPTTAPERRAEIAGLCSGFVYYLAVSGVTGERDKLPEDLERNLKIIKELTSVPICVGFGVAKTSHLQQLAGLADGAIVGSALVKRIKEAVGQGPGGIADVCRDFCHELLRGLR